MLPRTLIVPLQQPLKAIKQLHERDIQQGDGRAYLRNGANAELGISAIVSPLIY
jgi:hypothetical protein